jgi:hypothetical protein
MVNKEIGYFMGGYKVVIGGEGALSPIRIKPEIDEEFKKLKDYIKKECLGEYVLIDVVITRNDR